MKIGHKVTLINNAAFLVILASFGWFVYGQMRNVF